MGDMKLRVVEAADTEIIVLPAGALEDLVVCADAVNVWLKRLAKGESLCKVELDEKQRWLEKTLGRVCYED